jgi:AraC-like DNA-binding protein
MKTEVKSCTVTRPVRTKAPDAEATAQGPGGYQAASLKWAAEVEPSELFAFKECQDLFQTRLTEPLLRLIAQLTGLRLRILWHGPLDFQGLGERPVLCPRARQRTGANGLQPKRCEFCLRRRWKFTLSPTNQGRRFIGQCGITNFCACLQVDKVCPLTLVLQAAVAPRSPSPHSVRQGSSNSHFAGLTAFGVHPSGCLPPVNTLKRGHQTRLESVSPAAFHHAMALARLILHDLESTAQARMASSGLENALRRLNKTQIEAACLRGELRHRLPGLPESTVQPGLGSHAQKLVEAMLDFVHHHYHRPISLDDLASAMRMNGSYLSALFSQTTGVTFHQFLEEVRLSKAKALLRDPRNRVGEVACAAGYASPDAFRHAFKAHEGLSPEAWRAGQ